MNKVNSIRLRKFCNTMLTMLSNVSNVNANFIKNLDVS